MIPVERWTIFYADGSTFTSADGTWAEAPPFGVFATVYYDISGVKHVRMEQHDNSIYRYLAGVEGAVEVEGECVGGSTVKFGLWIDNDEYLMLFDAVHGMVAP
jgi:hypothetical protein